MKFGWKKIIICFLFATFVLLILADSSVLAVDTNTPDSTSQEDNRSGFEKTASWSNKVVSWIERETPVGYVTAPTAKVIDATVQATMDVLAIILAQIQLFVSTILQSLMNFMDFLLGSTGAVLDNKGVHSGWTQVRDLCNMLFIFILLGIAFMTVFFGTEGTSYSIKKALPLLIIAILTINFSFFICRVIVEGTDIAARSLIAEEETGVLGDIMGIKKMGTVSLPSSSEWGAGLEEILLEGESSTPAGPGGTSTSGSSSE